MLKLLTDENLRHWDNEGTTCSVALLLEQIKSWSQSLTDSWYDDIIYQTLDRVVDLILDNLEE